MSSKKQSTKKILIIEDDFYVRKTYNEYFSQAGYDVELAGNASEANHKLKNHQFDLILLDVMLPKSRGTDLLRNWRKSGSPLRKTPVFIITNVAEKSTIKEAFKLGAQGYLLKTSMHPQDFVSEIYNFFAEQNINI